MICRHGLESGDERWGDKGVIYRVRLHGGALDGMELDVLDQGQI
jgi:hypothetical protein